MATVVEFTVDSSVFPLGSVFENLPGVRVELERVVPREEGTEVVPYFWVEGADVDDIESQFAAHPGVRDIELVDGFENQYLMRCEWVREYTGILEGLTETNVTLLVAVGTENEWQFEVRGDTQGAITDFQQYTLEHEIPIAVVSLHALTPLETNAELTDAQREALQLAYERGYYDFPRETTLSEIADELGITQQALAARLRRGTRHLIESGSFDR